SYLAGKGVAARVFSLNIKHGGRSKAIWPVRVGRELNESITRIMEECLPKQQAGLLAGILTGNREGLGDTVKDAFSAAGLTHIMAVSGANVAFIVLPLTFLLKKIKVPLKIANIMIICFLVVFIFITGFEPSVLRAVIMAVFILTAQLLRRDSDILTVIAASALVLLLASPYMLYNIGFQLSYSATIALVLLFNDVKKLVSFRFIPEFLSSVLAATITAQLGVLPLTLLYFNRVSVVSLLTNLLVVPLIEIVTVTGMIMAVSGHIHLMLAQLPGYVNCTLLSFILYVVKLSYKLPFAVLTTATPPLFAVMAYYPVVYFAMKRGPSYFAGMKPSKILRHIAVALLLLLIFFVGIQNLTPEKLEVVFLDVGEGDCTFIRSANGSLMLIDGGGSTNPLRESGIGDSTVLPFLLDNGVTSMEAVLATHGHADHTQGLETVLERLPVKNLILPEIQDVEAPAGGFGELLKIAEEKGVKVSYCSEGDEIRLDSETKLKVLNPGINETSLSSGALNNTSLVVKLLYADVSILFTGDAGTAVEERLLKKRTELDVDIIKIAHHGSVTATGFEFLEAVSPLAAIISVGRNNFGHPSQKVLQNVGDSGAILLRTDECGAVMLEVTDGTFLNKNSEIRIKRMVSQ
ncbi:MAG: DNA internalization-related competence protein ComEC/Rec2, partial [Clostridiales bacterium]|nr:DNA internalization-related competence protein ComEC/Rec2 [Clostridiales bacterium]